MKILQINSHYDQGGAARIAACIHRELLNEGQQSYVAYGRGEKSKEKNVYRFENSAEIYFSALMSRLTGINGWWNRLATRRLLRIMEKIQPDVVHIHALHGYYLNFPMLFKYINNHDIPCVWTFHDCHAFTGNCGYFFDCDRWKTGCGSCPYIHNYPASQFFDFTSSMWIRKKEMFTCTESDRKVIVTPSDWLTGEAEKSFFGKYPCITIHNGIDTENSFYPRDREECRRKYGYKQDERLVLGIAAGYSDPRKGAKYIIEAAKKLSDEATIILIGWEEKNNAMLEGCVNIITLPSTGSKNELAEYYSMADVFVLPSLAENYATTALEAMACGTPVVGFDAGGTSELLKGGRGILVPSGDQEEFTKAIRDILAGKAKLLPRQGLSEKIAEENSQKGMVGKYMEIYNTFG